MRSSAKWVRTYKIERCCEDLTHETHYVMDSNRHVIAACPSLKCAEDLARALTEGTAPEEFRDNMW